MSIKHAADDDVPAIAPERRRGNRRLQPGLRSGDHDRSAPPDDAGSDVAHDDIRALIAAVQDAQRRDREIYDRELAEVKESAQRDRTKHEKLTGRVLVAAGAFATLVFLANWIGPTVVRKAIGVLIGTP